MKTLTKVAIGSSIKTIRNQAFYNCSALKALTIGKSATSIGASAFDGCAALPEVTIPGAVREIGANAFAGCSALQTINMINPIPAVIENSTFPSTVLNSASLNVPEESKIMYWLHPYWGQFKSITLWNVGSDTEFSDDQLTMHIMSDANSTVEISSFENLGNTDIVVPETVDLNGREYAIAGVANNAFAGSKVESVELPSTISYVGLGAFSGCNRLISLKLNAMLPPSVADESFDVEHFQKVKLLVPYDAVEAYQQHDVWKRFNISDFNSGIDDIELDPDNFAADGQWKVCDVYNLQGIRVLHNATCEDFNNLSPGYYILRGHKIFKQ